MLGRTGIEVTRLGFGSMELRHTGTPARPGLDHAAAGALLHTVLDLGITYIDTSPTYGPAEELIGEYLAPRRDEFTLATKAGFVVEEFPNRRHLLTPENIRHSLEWSLRRLGADYVDLVQLPGSPTPAELDAIGALDALEALRAEGKCRYIGISGWVPGLTEHVAPGRIDVFQIPYSALEPENEELIAMAAGAGVGTVIRGGVAQGRTVAIADRAEELRSSDELEHNRAKWNDAVGDGSGSDVTLLLRYTLSHPQVNTVIAGTADPRHLAENVAAAELGPLPAATVEAIRRRLIS
jgi:aryl-alcohol dehydrogenase-like predicted oxidoreductase